VNDSTREIAQAVQFLFPELLPCRSPNQTETGLQKQEQAICRKAIFNPFHNPSDVLGVGGQRFVPLQHYLDQRFFIEIFFIASPLLVFERI
jgi:hypothetical protein